MSEPAEPYRPRLRRRNRRGVVLGGIVAVLVAAFLTYAVVQVVSENPEAANLGSDVFRFEAGRLAEEIGKRGPFLLKDPLNRGREVYVQHRGDDPDEGWFAISAYAGDPDVDCILEWIPPDEEFRDPCTDERYPADGGSLDTYKSEARDGFVEIDLRTR